MKMGRSGSFVNRTRFHNLNYIMFGYWEIRGDFFYGVIMGWSIELGLPNSLITGYQKTPVSEILGRGL